MTVALPWPNIRLVVFDVDGTLYSQRRLRPRMALELGLASLAGRELTRAKALSSYRRLREELAEAGGADFENSLRHTVAARHARERGWVDAMVADWMHRRPLKYLPACVVPGASALFAALRKSGRQIGVLSDYPAHDKLDAMGLKADFVVSAEDPAVQRLKPDPAGLRHIIALAGASAETTLMIGDRDERDGEIARRAGTHALIRRTRRGGKGDFVDFHDAVFDGFKRA